MSRVLWVSTETPDRFGQGGQRRQYHQIRELARRGHEIEVVCLAGPQSDKSVREWARVRRIRLGWRGWMSGRRVFRMRESIARAHCDAVIVAHVESWWMLPEPFSVSVPVLLDVHNTLSHWYDSRGLGQEASSARQQESRALVDATAIMTCSDLERDRLMSVHPEIAEKTFSAPIGVDPAEWPDRDFSDPTPTVALFGTWSWFPNERGLAWFASQVWPRVIAHEPTARAKVAGSGARDTAHWPSGMEYVGRVPDVGLFVSRAAAVAVPVCDGVGASMKFPEALASGAAVIATTDGANGVADSPAFVSDEPTAWADWIVARVRSRRSSDRPDPARAFALNHLTWRDATEPIDRWLGSLPASAHG